MLYQNNMKLLLFLAFSLLNLFSGFATESFFSLKNNLKKAEKGDYLVIAQGRNYTLFHVFDKQKEHLAIEEITIPTSLARETITSWKFWLASNAPQNTSWLMYEIDLNIGKLQRAYSFTKNCWLTFGEADHFFQTLLQLRLYPIPLHERRKIGPNPRGNTLDQRPYWQPKMVVDGVPIEGVFFDAYYTYWPLDGGPLSGKKIEIYLPQDSEQFPAYFPYWLQVKGVLGPAKVRIVDSGKNARSPKKGL